MAAPASIGTRAFVRPVAGPNRRVTVPSQAPVLARRHQAAAEKRQRRAQRWDLLAPLRQVSTLKRLRACRRKSINPNGNVGLRVSGAAGSRVVGYSGLATCGSVWACPCCAAKIAQARADDLGHVLGWASNAGHTVALLTLTARHNASQPLRQTWNAIGTAWSRVTGGRPWEKITDSFGVLGFARAVEVTYGDNGWHPHLHVVLVLEGPVSHGMVRLLGERMWDTWTRGLAKKGYTAIRDQVDGKSLGLDIRVSTDATDALAEYFVKQLAIEATHGHAKQGRKNGRTPFQVAADFFATGDLDDLDRWHEWEQGSRGRRQLTWSQGLREMAGLAEDQATDEEIAAAEEIGDDDMLQLPGDTWRAIRDTAYELLDAAETEGPAGAARWLRVRRLDFIAFAVPGRPPPR